MPTYREPACIRRAVTLEPAAPRSLGGALLGSFAALAGAGALALGQPELLVFLGAGALAAASQTWRERGAHRQASRLISFLGSADVTIGPGTWTSLDGRRRLRSAPSDDFVRFERLDPSTGTTLASYRARVPLAPESSISELVERRVAPLLGRDIGTARCFDGLPPELGGGAIPIAGARSVILEIRREGVLLLRCDANGRRLADTFHPDLGSALRQLECEHGEHVGAFRSVPPLARSSAGACWDVGSGPPAPF